MNANNAQNYRSDRRISVGMTVDNVKELPKAGAQLKRFLTEIDVDHGPFDLNIIVSVGGYDFLTIEIVSAPAATEEEGE